MRTKTTVEDYNDRPTSRIIKKMMDEKGIKASFLAKKIGVKSQSFYNKLSRNVWTFDEIATIAYTCGYEILIADRETQKSKDFIKFV